MELEYSIDYLSVTTKDNVSSLRHPKLPVRVKERGRGMFGYNQVLDYDDGRFEAYSTTRPDVQGRLMTYGGSALRRCAEYGLSTLDVLRWHHAMLHKMTRVDFAIDVYDSDLDIFALKDQKQSGKIDTNSKSFYFADDTEGGVTFYIGYKRPKMVRIYDKAKEQGIDGLNWKRIEGQYRREYATQVGEAIANAQNPANPITGHLRGFVDFPDCSVWSRIMDAEKMKVAELPKSGGKTLQWLLGDVAKAIAKLKTGDHPDIMQHLEDAVTGEVAHLIAQYKLAN